MKHPKSPTKKQKILIKNNNLNPDNWFVERILKDEIVIIHKTSKKKKHILKV